ncbi:hypothetical protein ACFYPZ_36870 [Streptomyces sp. NPDC005506]|uniref:hypothetical protein n=1 Tax=unclassified Streptomyces TaxID=2593676 RepID=UPI00369CC822
MLQFLLGLSDRQAAEAVRCRIDFKYAMRATAPLLGDRLSLRHHGALRAARTHHPLEGLRRPAHRDVCF